MTGSPKEEKEKKLKIVVRDLGLDTLGQVAAVVLVAVHIALAVPGVRTALVALNPAARAGVGLLRGGCSTEIHNTAAGCV